MNQLFFGGSTSIDNLIYAIVCHHHTKGRGHSVKKILYCYEPVAFIIITMQIFCMHILHWFPDFLLLVWRTQLCFLCYANIIVVLFSCYVIVIFFMKTVAPNVRSHHMENCFPTGILFVHWQFLLLHFLVEQDEHFDGNSWRELFDVVIAQANKPTFYNSDHPFRLCGSFLCYCSKYYFNPS